MLRLLLLILLVAPVYGPCSKKRPQPQPIPQPTVQPTPDSTPTPALSPSPTPIARVTPTPFPTPDIDVKSFIPAARQGTIVRLRGEEGEDYAAKIQAVMDNSAGVALVELGPGSLKRSIIVRTHVSVVTSKATPLSCDQTEGIVGDIKPGEQPWHKWFPYSNYGCILVADGVHVFGNFQPPQELRDYFAQGKTYLGYTDPYFLRLAALSDDQIHGEYSTIVEPEFALNPANPGVIVIQALEDAKDDHKSRASNIAVTGIVFQGRQKTYDGGVRQTVTLGNCHTCSAQRNYLRDTASIGLQAGGNASKGNFANGVVFFQNISSGVAAANIAAVNAENVYAFNNYTRRPGRIGFGGGVSSFDLETNTPNDHAANVYIYNNLADYEDSAFPAGAGSAFVAQDPYPGPNAGKVIVANNVAIGGRASGNVLWRNMSNGYYLVGLKDCEVVNNYAFRTGQNALQAYALDGCVIQDNDFEMTGGGGNYTVHFIGVRNTVYRRNAFRATPNLPINADPSVEERQGSCGNVYEDYRIDGVDVTHLIKQSPPCASPSP